MIICDDPLVAEAAYNRNKYLNRFLCWVSPQLLYTSILDKQKAVGPTLPLRVLTATLADRVASLVSTRPVASPNKMDQKVGFDERCEMEIFIAVSSREISMIEQVRVWLHLIHWQH